MSRIRTSLASLSLLLPLALPAQTAPPGNTPAPPDRSQAQPTMRQQPSGADLALARNLPADPLQHVAARIPKPGRSGTGRDMLAEPLRHHMDLQKIAQEKLMKVVPFTDADLAMNDDGFFPTRSKNGSNREPTSTSH